MLPDSSVCSNVLITSHLAHRCSETSDALPLSDATHHVLPAAALLWRATIAFGLTLLGRPAMALLLGSPTMEVHQHEIHSSLCSDRSSVGPRDAF